MTAPIPLVIDTDPGIDDALALLLALASPEVDLRLVTTVHGNVDLAQTTDNALRVLHLAGRADVPVAAGAASSLVHAQPERAGHVPGTAGLGGVELPPSPAATDPRPAVVALAELLLSSPDPVTVAAIGPLTNIALLLRTYPEVARGLREIVFMGGAAHVGNATASAEFNVFHDPEAAAVVLDACADLDIAVTMYGLDVFYAPRISREEAAELVAVGGHGPAELAGRLIAFQAERFASDSATIGDAGAVCAVLAPDGVQREKLPVRVELAGTWSRGRTIVDRRDWTGDLSHDPHGRARSTIDVCLEVDAGRYARLWLDTVSGRTS